MLTHNVKKNTRSFFDIPILSLKSWAASLWKSVLIVVTVPASWKTNFPTLASFWTTTPTNFNFSPTPNLLTSMLEYKNWGPSKHLSKSFILLIWVGISVRLFIQDMWYQLFLSATFVILRPYFRQCFERPFFAFYPTQSSLRIWRIINQTYSNTFL